MKINKNAPKRYLSLLIVLMALQVAVTVFFLVSKLEITTIISAAAVITIFAFADVLLCVIIIRSRALIKKARDAEALEQNRRFELDYYELVKMHRQEIATMKHEIANQLQVATTLLKSTDLDDKRKGAQLLVDMRSKNSDQLDVMYCNNSIINTMLAVKFKIAKAYDIKYKYEIQADENLSITKLDLCSIFGNLLDNATEAAKRAEEKYIEVKAGVLAGYFVIKVKNSKANAIAVEKNEIKTTKTDKENHGKGLKLLKRIAEKYNGKASFEYTDDSFLATLTLKVSI